MIDPARRRQRLAQTIILALGLICTALGTSPGWAAQSGAYPDTTMIHETDLAVNARDGTRLSAHVFRPEGDAPLPVILSFTPYAVQELLPRARFFAGNGYVFVAVSARGRGDSDGTFDPFSTRDGEDTGDAIAWAAEQPWSNCRVGMWGGSYLGYAQWAAAGQRPSALKTIVPAAAVFPGVDYPGWGPVNLTYQFQWLQALQGRSDWFDTAFDDAGWAEATRIQRRDGKAFADLAARSGKHAPIARKWLAAEPADWRKAVPSDAALADLDIPVLTITGQFDGDQRGALAHHARWLAAQGGAAERSFVLIGPWDHGGTRTPYETMAGQAVDPQSVIDMNALHLAWYDWTLKDGPRPDLLADRLTYFVLGTGEWRSAPSLAALDHDVTLHLVPGEGQHGKLGAEARAADYRYRLDTRTAGLANPIGFELLPGDVSDVAALGEDGLVFGAEPLDQPMELIGMPRFSAWFASQRPDGDIFASLIALAPDGRATRIGFDVVRLRQRNGPDSEALMQPGQFAEVRFEQFGFVARQLAAGTQLQLVLHSNPSAIFEINYAGGGAVAQETAANGGAQVISIRQRPAQPAMLILPLRQLERGR
jgi:putative CocE/NonD family hydrolase